jgi:hypothetical protein
MRTNPAAPIKPLSEGLAANEDWGPPARDALFAVQGWRPAFRGLAHPHPNGDVEMHRTAGFVCPRIPGLFIHEVAAGSRWAVSAVPCGYRITEFRGQRRAALAALRLASAIAPLAIWPTITPTVMAANPSLVDRVKGEINAAADPPVTAAAQPPSTKRRQPSPPHRRSSR